MQIFMNFSCQQLDRTKPGAKPSRTTWLGWWLCSCSLLVLRLRCNTQSRPSSDHIQTQTTETFTDGGNKQISCRACGTIRTWTWTDSLKHRDDVLYCLYIAPSPDAVMNCNTAASVPECTTSDRTRFCPDEDRQYFAYFGSIWSLNASHWRAGRLSPDFIWIRNQSCKKSLSCF